MIIRVRATAKKYTIERIIIGSTLFFSFFFSLSGYKGDNDSAGRGLLFSCGGILLKVNTSLSRNGYSPEPVLFSLAADDIFLYSFDYRIDESGSYFDPEYKPDNKAFICNVNLHLQTILRGNSENSNRSTNFIVLTDAFSGSKPGKIKFINSELS